MAFPSIAFGYFFLVVFTLAWALRRRRAARNARAAGRQLRVLRQLAPAAGRLAAGAVAARLGPGPGACPGRVRRARPGRCWRWAWLANVGLLAALKLYDFFRESVARVAGWLGLERTCRCWSCWPRWACPSTCSRASATWSTPTGPGRPQPQPPAALLDFLLFMAFFPKLLAGPICRAHELLPQMARPAPATPARAGTGAGAGAVGADQEAGAGRLPVDPHGGRRVPDARAARLAGAGGGAVRLLAPRSTSTSAATPIWPAGLALLLGFELPENFRQPYAAPNIGEFWRRWHMTFSRFLRDYVYFPLGGSRRVAGAHRAEPDGDHAGVRAVARGHLGLRHLGAAARHWRWWRTSCGGTGGDARDPARRDPAPSRRRLGWPPPLVLGGHRRCSARWCGCFSGPRTWPSALAYLGALARPEPGHRRASTPAVVAMTALCFVRQPPGSRPFDGAGGRRCSGCPARRCRSVLGGGRHRAAGAADARDDPLHLFRVLRWELTLNLHSPGVGGAWTGWWPRC